MSTILSESEISNLVHQRGRVKALLTNAEKLLA